LLSTALGIWDLIKNSGHYKDSENWALEWIGPIPGKRESRRFMGDYVLKEQDCKTGEVFEDGVAFGGWPLDLHHPKGIHTDEPPFISIKTPMYNIPFRCLYSRNISNLLFAGRHISASHVAFGSTRVMGTCSVLGQAAGTAAALCIKHKCTPRALGKESVKELQQQLLKDDAYIIGAVNHDPGDHARTAAVRASSIMQKEYGADNVINGIARGVFQSKNGWVSNPDNGFPQWIELKFPQEKRIREIYVTFDTGLNRQLTLTHSDGNHRHQIWGPQPETVCDYEIQVLHGESAETVAQVKGNYQRRRIHAFEARPADGIRLIVHSTNGSKEARIFEIRAYS
ncbi:MAG: FAD-dependent oxidoreductase, partial [Candidatus Hinthialibacter sp.]